MKFEENPVICSDEIGEYILNNRGAKIYIEPNKQPKLKIIKKICLCVEAVGFNKFQKPIVTIKQNNKFIAYELDEQLYSWAFDCVALSYNGTNLFPSKVEFGIRTDGSLYAEIL